MDCWASLEHQLRYKSSYCLAEETSNELLKCAELSAELDSRMGKLRQKVDTTQGAKINAKYKRNGNIFPYYYV